MGTVQTQTEDVIVYPNPVSDKIIVEFKNKDGKEHTITIFDVPGQLIKSVTSNNHKEVISIPALSKGIYFLKVSSDGISVTKKILVK